jgi:hypothetical protein
VVVVMALAACDYAPERVGEVDAPIVIDAFLPGRDCPAEYTIQILGHASRYRVILAGAAAWVHSDDCNDDRPGRTHLAAIDDGVELDGLAAVVNTTANLDRNRAWLGGVQPRDQATAIAGWLSVTGGPLIATEWRGGEPNDGGGNNVENNQENFIGVEKNVVGLDDFTDVETAGAICECDGNPVDPAASAAIDANRN